MAILGIPSTSIVDSTVVGRELITAADAAAARLSLELSATDDVTFNSVTATSVIGSNSLYISNLVDTASISLAGSGAVTIKAHGAIYQQFTTTGIFSRRDVAPTFDGTLNLGLDANRWANTYSVDGSFTGNLNTEVGGSQRVYNLGTEGDTDSEYLETSWDTNTARIQTKETGAGVGRILTVGAGSTYANYAYNSVLTLYSFGQRAFRAEGGATYMYFGNAKLLKLTAGVVGTDTTNTVSLGTDAVRWSDVYSVDGSFSGNLNVESGGSQRIYNLGTEGDVDTEYLETSFTSNKAILTTKNTGTGVKRNLTMGDSTVSQLAIQAAQVLIYDGTNIAVRVDTFSTEFFLNGIKPNGNGVQTCGQLARRWANTYSVDGNFSGDVIMAANVDFTGLPTSDPLVAGRLWNHNDTMKISAG